MNPTKLLAVAALAYWWKGHSARVRIRTVLEQNPQVRQAMTDAGFDIEAENYMLPAVAVYALTR